MMPSVAGATAKGGDVQRALGCEWTPSGQKKRYALSNLAMDAPPTGVNQLLSGPGVDIGDHDGLQAEARMVRSLGYTGYQIIHQSHLEVVNEVFTPDLDEIERSRDLFDTAKQADGIEDKGAFRYEGGMVDRAHIQQSNRF